MTSEQMRATTRMQKHQARQHLKAAWTELYLLPFNDKTPAIRTRMQAITNKLEMWRA